jgi:hypothetical protein
VKIGTLVAALVISWIFLHPPERVRAQSDVNIRSHKVNFLFGHHIAFEAEIESSQPIREVEIFFRENGAADTLTLAAEVDSNNIARGVYEIGQGRSIQAFTEVTYWFQVTLRNRKIVASENFRFSYTDNRFTWTTLEEPPFTVHTYQGDGVFAQGILDMAIIGLKESTRILGPPSIENIDIYVYSNSDDLQYALNLSGQTWIAGHADPTLGVALVSIRPGPLQQIESGRQVPHEVTHFLLYQATLDGYANLPAWLNEGIASLAENDPETDFSLSVQKAADAGNLIPLADLCAAFPTDAASAGLAYAQSTSFVSYLQDEYGVAGLNQLIADYASGLDCKSGIFSALGSSFDQFERQWHSSFLRFNPTQTALQEMLPWLTILVLMLAGPVALMFAQRNGAFG